MDDIKVLPVDDIKVEYHSVEYNSCDTDCDDVKKELLSDCLDGYNTQGTQESDNNYLSENKLSGRANYLSEENFGNVSGNEEQIEHFNTISDSEESGATQYIDYFQEGREDEYHFYIGKDGEAIWKSTPAGSPHKIKKENIVEVFSGPKGKNIETELEAFLTFISEDIIDNIVTCTNIYIELRKADVPYQRDRDCQLTSRTEILAFFGALFLISVKNGNHVNLQELWTNDGTGMIKLRAAFGYKRFQFLLSSIHFDNITSREEREKTDRIAAIRNTYTAFVHNCMQNYNLGESIRVDEMFQPFRGQCDFVEYMPENPANYGIKFDTLCDSKTCYTWNFEIFCRSQFKGAYKTCNKPFHIVHRLVNPIKNSYRELRLDNYYTSYSLCASLLQNGIVSTGALQKNKKEIPPEFLPDKLRAVGSTLFGFQDDITLISYVTKKNKAVILLSSMHNSSLVGERTLKPRLIREYLSTKSGVDQKCASYPTQRITKKWPLAVFFRFLDIAGINAEIIFNSNKCLNKPHRRREFLTQLSFLLMEQQLIDRAPLQMLPKDISQFLSQYRTPVAIIETECNNQNRTGKCRVCAPHKNTKTTVTCGLCQQFVCRNHCKKIVRCNVCMYPPMEED